MKQLLCIMLLIIVLASCSQSSVQFRVKLLDTDTNSLMYFNKGMQVGDTVLTMCRRDANGEPVIAKVVILKEIK